MSDEATKGMEELDVSMSNFDHEIPPEMEPALKARPNQVFACHHGWEFNGRVWFDGDKFNEQVWRHHVPRAVLSAPTLRELMTAVNDEWGYE